MEAVRIAAVMRAGEYSPNHIGPDAAIIDAVADRLRRRRCRVVLYTEDQLRSGMVKEKIIVNMCREHSSTEILRDMESLGALVINSGYGIDNCLRGRQAMLLIQNGIPFARTIVVDTDASVVDRLKKLDIGRCWIKRADHHSRHAEDVCYARSASGAQDVLAEFFLRGYRNAVIQKHIPGRLVKFYGVVDTDFFHWFRPFDAEDAVMTADDEATGAKLRELCTRAAEILGVTVYGGECIEGDDGELTMIDFNDWPSFAPCRAEATIAIADVVMSRLKRWRKQNAL